MADLINSGNKKDKWTKKVTDWINWLNEKKQAKLVAGDNVTLTPQQDGTVEISAGGGAVALDDLTDVDVSSVTDGQALVYDAQNQEWVAGEAGQVDDVKVNGTSVVTNKIAEITSYKEVTKAEYDALGNEKYSDGILYCIKDANITPVTFLHGTNEPNNLDGVDGNQYAMLNVGGTEILTMYYKVSGAWIPLVPNAEVLRW